MSEPNETTHKDEVAELKERIERLEERVSRLSQSIHTTDVCLNRLAGFNIVPVA